MTCVGCKSDEPASEADPVQIGSVVVQVDVNTVELSCARID